MADCAATGGSLRGAMFGSGSLKTAAQRPERSVGQLCRMGEPRTDPHATGGGLAALIVMRDPHTVIGVQKKLNV